ncbi:ABC transporter ATP-binding protein [Pseudoroseicyclus sp. H15]
MTKPVLELNGVKKSYGGKPALRGVTMEVRRGELVGLLGPNGAGKSTLFQICAGLFAPDGGEVKLFGLDYRDAPSAILARVGVVFQSRSLDADISVRANLRFHGGLFGLWGQDLRRRIAQMADLMEISDLLDRPVRQLSGGNQRRVEIARAMLSQPELLLLDEPSTGLDPASRQRLVTDIAALAEREGTAVLWSTHLAEEVEAAARIVLLVQGEVRREETPATLLAETGTEDLTGAYIALTGLPPSAATPQEGEVPEA